MGWWKDAQDRLSWLSSEHSTGHVFWSAVADTDADCLFRKFCSSLATSIGDSVRTKK